MKHEAFTQWFAGCAGAPGVLGGGLRLPDGVCLAESFNDKWSREKLEETLPQLAAALTMLSNYGFAPQWLTWTFKQGQIRLVAHSGGSLLALAVEPNTPAAHNLDQFTQEFLALDFGD